MDRFQSIETVHFYPFLTNHACWYRPRSSFLISHALSWNAHIHPFLTTHGFLRTVQLHFFVDRSLYVDLERPLFTFTQQKVRTVGTKIQSLHTLGMAVKGDLMSSWTIFKSKINFQNFFNPGIRHFLKSIKIDFLKQIFCIL